MVYHLPAQNATSAGSASTTRMLISINYPKHNLTQTRGGIAKGRVRLSNFCLPAATLETMIAPLRTERTAEVVADPE